MQPRYSNVPSAAQTAGGLDISVSMARVDLAAPETPALILDRGVVERNVSRMAERARRAGAALWPHAKPHQSVELARLERSSGATGLTGATLREAELSAAEGFGDILAAYPPGGESRFDRLVALARRARVRVAFDDGELVDAWPVAARGWA
jgi:D-serine deaminase-like pyridoxal phosphate-dependent protein